MAAILRHQIADEPRLPYRHETEIVAHLGQAGETCGRQPDLDRRAPPRRACADRPCDRLPGADKGRRTGRARPPENRGPAAGQLANIQRSCRVASTSRPPEAANPKRLVELPHQQRDPPAVPADHRHLAGLVRRDGHRSAGLRKPILKLRRRRAGNGNRCVCRVRIVHRILIACPAQYASARTVAGDSRCRNRDFADLSVTNAPTDRPEARHQSSHVPLLPCQRSEPATPSCPVASRRRHNTPPS